MKNETLKEKINKDVDELIDFLKGKSLSEIELLFKITSEKIKSRLFVK